MSKAVCVLAHWEADDYIKNDRIPDCVRHMHIKLAEAHEMTSGFGTYRRPVAEWVGRGERRITMLVDFDYVPKKTATGHVVLNRIEL